MGVYGVIPTDVHTLTAASVGLIAVSGLAALIPSSRAARIELTTSLRSD